MSYGIRVIGEWRELDESKATMAHTVEEAEYLPSGRRSRGGGQYRRLWGRDCRETANGRRRLFSSLAATPEAFRNLEKLGWAREVTPEIGRQGGPRVF